MSTQLQFRRGNTAQHAAFTGVDSEVTVDTDKRVVVVHDGITPGGFPAPTLEYTQAAYNLANATLSYIQVPYGRANVAWFLANNAFNRANAAYDEANSKVSLAGGTMTGNLEVPNLTITGNLSVDYVLAANDIEANNIIIQTTLYSGLATHQATPLPNLIAQFTGNTNSYVQVNAQNIDPNGSGDFVVTADVGNDTTYFIDMGIQGSNLTQGALHPLDGYLIVQGNTGQLGGNLVVGTSISGTSTHIVAGGLEDANVVVIFTDDMTSTFTGNVNPSVDNTQYLGSPSKRWHSLYVGPGSINIDDVVLSNNNGVLSISGATDIVLANSTVPPSSEISTYANSAYAQANTGTLIAQAAFDSANNVAPQIQPSFDHANAAYSQANTGTLIAQAAFDSANNVAPQIQPSFDHANAAFSKANSAYSAAADASSYASDIELYAQSGFGKANSANVLAQASFDHANTKFASAGGTISGDVTITGQANVHSRLAVGEGSFVILPNLIAQFTGTSDFYSQINQQNLSGLGSGDIVVTANNGTDSVNYTDMGMAGGDYDNTTPNAFPMVQPNDGYLITVGNPSQMYGGNLYVGTAGSGAFADISFIQGNGFAESARLVYNQGLVIKTGTVSSSNDTGALVVQGGIGATGAIRGDAIYDSGVRLTTAISDANTAMKSYVDTANTSLKSYIDSSVSDANSSLKLYTDGIVAANLSTSESYTDSTNTWLQGSISTTNTFAGNAYNKANSANVLAQSANDNANTRFLSTGGNITGNVVITGNNNLTITGSLYVYGNTTTTDISTISVANSIIYVSKDNAANTVDSGIVGSFTQGNYQHTGVVRNHLTGEWTFFSNVITEPTTTVNWTESGINYDTIKVGNIVSPIATINGIEIGGYSTAAFTKANTGVDIATYAAGKANGAVQTGFTTISANGTSITPSSNTDTVTITAAKSNGINVLIPSSKTIDLGLATSGVVAGTYGGSTNIPVIVTDAFGRVTSASNVAVSTTINLSGGTGTGSVAGGGTLTFTGSTGLTTSVTGSTITLTNTGVTSLTSNNTGRITQNGTSGAVTFDLATTGITAGTYSYPSIQVDSYGRTVAISNQTPVTSWNGMTGAVTLSSANVVSALTYTPANKAGDNFTGAVIATNLTSNTTVSINGVGVVSTNTYTTSSTTQVEVDAFSLSTFRSAKYEVQMTSGSSYHVIELRVLSDGVVAYVTQYGEMFTGSSLGTFDVSVATGVVSLLFTATNATTTVKLIRSAIAA